MLITLTPESKRSIEKATGLSYAQITSMEIEDIDRVIEKKIGKKLQFSNKEDIRLPKRGSVYLAFNRFFDFNHKKMNKFIDSLSI